MDGARKRIIADKVLVTASLAFIAAPIILQLLLWCKLYISVPASLLLVFLVVRVVRSISPLAHQETQSIFRPKALVIVSVLVVAFTLISGAGGFFYQNWDYNFRNAILHDLVENRQPVTYTYPTGSIEAQTIGAPKGVLTYYSTLFIPGSIIGKVTHSFGMASAAMFLLQCCGTVLIMYLIFRLLRRTQIRYFFFLLMIGGLDIMGMTLRNNIFTIEQLPPMVGIFHLDIYNPPFGLSTFTSELFYVFNQAIPAWILTLLFLNFRNHKLSFFFVALLFPFAPFPAVGLGVYALATCLLGFDFAGIAATKRAILSVIKRTLSLENVLVFLVIAPIVLLYLDNTSEKGLVLWQYRHQLARFMLGIFIFFTCDLSLFFLIITRKNYKHVLVPVGIIVAISLFYVGSGIDFVNRASIPLLVVLSVEVIRYLDSWKQHSEQRRVLVSIYLTLAAITSFNEINKNIVYTIRNHPTTQVYADSIKTFHTFTSSDMPPVLGRNFVGRYDEKSLLVRYVLR